MTFESFDSRGHRERFPGLQLAWDSLAAAPGTTAVLNAANEDGGGRLPGAPHPLRPDPPVNLATLAAVAPSKPASLQDLLAIDAQARARGGQAIRGWRH
jgi:1-deoxy-D-xylulose-5-phosphate reductoisomerase